MRQDSLPAHPEFHQDPDLQSQRFQFPLKNLIGQAMILTQQATANPRLDLTLVEKEAGSPRWLGPPSVHLDGAVCGQKSLPAVLH